MTTRLNCRDVERLTLAGEDRELAAGERRLIDEHGRDCERCRAFAADRAAIHAAAAALSWPAAPEALVRTTRRRLAGSEAGARPAVPPAWVLAAMAVVAVATGLWLTVSLAGVTPDMTLADLPAAGLAAVLIIIQNALMLLFAPVVLRKVRGRRGASESA